MAAVPISASPTVAALGRSTSSDAPPRLLLQVPTSVTGAVLTVEEERNVRTLYLDDLCQSDVIVQSDGSLSKVQPLELVQIMSLLTLGWVSGGPKAIADPRVLLLGLGGGSIARVLAAALPPGGSVHSVELEPEVIDAASKYFGLELSEPRCTAEAADCAAFLKQRHQGLREVNKAGDRKDGRYEVILLDAFTSEGLSPSTRENATLEAAHGCLSPTGILVVNLHTGPPKDPDDPDYYVARGVLRLLCRKFDSVYRVLCSTTQNLIAICHQGEFLDADEWGERLAKQRRHPEMKAACRELNLELMLERFELVGGKEEPLSEDDGPDVPPQFRSR